ncbi:MAG: uracil-xanthine permease family protein [Candidatus Izemoplasmataceae bacterium]|jgi:uracil permease|uniref:uracil-xanthine permease family protein n=1 Tax=Liberiplasma polymorphum TaxID=3374570 RepID=UPI003770D6B7
MEEKMILDVRDKPSSITTWLVLSLQHVFAMFGATVLVPILTGLSIGVALVASGVGTLIYIACTKGKVPVYLGSSFAYIAAIAVAGSVNGFGSAYIGLMFVGLIYVIVSFIIRFTGSGWIKHLLPPVVIGPVIIIIGLGLAGVAISSAGLDGASGWQIPVVALVTFSTVVGISIFAKGFLKIVPFLIAIAVGYVFSVVIGVVNLQEAFAGYRFLQVPDFTFFGTYALDFTAVIMFLPIAFVTIAEHIGDHTVLGEVTGKDFISDPGLDKTLLGDGIATMVSAMIGGPANTTYGENTGVVAMTRVASVYVTGVAAMIAIVLGFFGYVQAFVNSIPWAVIGGMTIILYGLIASNGVKVLVKAKVDLSNIRNLIIVATILVIGLGGAAIPLNDAVSLQGMSLAAVAGIILNLILPEPKKKEELAVAAK